MSLNHKKLLPPPWLAYPEIERYSFSQNMELKAFLLSTGDAILAEASPYDGIWGIRMQADAPDIVNPLKWRGQNLLGFALMEVRDELRRVTKNESLCEYAARNQSNSKLAK